MDITHVDHRRGRYVVKLRNHQFDRRRLTLSSHFAAVVFVICNIIAVHYIRKYYKRRKQRLPGAKGARRYEVGEYWQQRQEYLPNYTPPKPLLPVASSTSSMQPLMAQTASRPSQSSIRTPMSRASSRYVADLTSKEASL